MPWKISSLKKIVSTITLHDYVSGKNKETLFDGNLLTLLDLICILLWNNCFHTNPSHAPTTVGITCVLGVSQVQLRLWSTHSCIPILSEHCTTFNIKWNWRYNITRLVFSESEWIDLRCTISHIYSIIIEQVEVTVSERFIFDQI